MADRTEATPPPLQESAPPTAIEVTVAGSSNSATSISYNSLQDPSAPNPHEAYGLTKELLEAIDKTRVSLVPKDQMNSLPLRAYLDQTVVPVLVEGLKALAKERPPNPCEYLAVYLLRNSNAGKSGPSQ
ncbi:Dpy-30 motif-domain-containing protein [Powellomyces hirtus]|nr:Dpy-30 motif-domain-containing protein [Powellomyces hirtus]